MMLNFKRDRNPINGRHSAGYRFRFHVRAISHRPLYLPLAMKFTGEISRLLAGESPLSVFKVSSLNDARLAFMELRKRHDFTFWAAKEYHVRDIHDADSIVTLFLNVYQHHIIDTFLKRYFYGQVSRYIITKDFGRCGVTTCIQAYIFWLQLYTWPKNSNTCGASESNILPLKVNLLRQLHRNAVCTDKGIRIPIINRRAFFNTFHNPDALRGIDFAYVHFADMSKWKDTASVNSIRAYTAATGGVLLDYHTLIVMEGNVPKRTFFRVEENYPDNPNALKRCDYSKVCNNPFFLREVIDANDPSSHVLFHHIDLDALFLASG